jgi:hypothetical protein
LKMQNNCGTLPEQFQSRRAPPSRASFPSLAMGRHGASKLRLKKQPQRASPRLHTADSDDDFQAAAPPRSTRRSNRSMRILSQEEQEEQEEQELAIAIAASLSDSSQSEGQPTQPTQPTSRSASISTMDGGERPEQSNTVEVLSDSDAEALSNASEESDFDDASEEEEDDDDDSEGEEEADWQADEEERNPTGFGQPKPTKLKRKVAPTVARDKKKVRGQQGEGQRGAGSEAAAPTACTGDTADIQQPPLPAASTKAVSPAVSQLTSPAVPAPLRPAADTISAATGLEWQGSGTEAPGKPDPRAYPSLLKHTAATAAATTAAKLAAVPVPKPTVGSAKSVLVPMKQAPRHTGLPSGYKEQAAWAVQGAGLKRSSSGVNRLPGGAAIPVGGGRGIKGLGKSRPPAAGLKRGIKGRTALLLRPAQR